MINRCARRHIQTGSQFSPLRPINPSALPNRALHGRTSRGRRRAYYFLGSSAVIGASLYTYDHIYNGRAAARSIRALYDGAALVIDYKLNFVPEKADQINELHQRVADRIMRLIRENGGLYIKLGQAIAMQSAVLPQAYFEAFKTLFDEAPQVPYSEIERIFMEDFDGKRPDDLFVDFERTARASASIAQVHHARLPSGERVAVKIQKPEIAKQVDWDLGAYRLLMFVYDRYLFKVPVYFTVDYISQHLRAETDFIQEAKNAEVLADFVRKEPKLSSVVHIPKVYHKYSSPRIMTAEWIDGVRITDRENIEKMGLSLNDVMKTFVSLFAAQIFSFGHIHCDPHPGNVFVRRQANGSHEIVLIDHGLYIEEPAAFRFQYCEFWRALLTYDHKTVEAVAKDWGINFPDMLGTMTLMQPYKAQSDTPAAPIEEKDEYQQQIEMKEKFRKFLGQAERLPLQLIFLGRNMRIVQATNQMLGSPVNRPGIMAEWASRSLARRVDLTWSGKLRAWADHAKFSFAMLLLDLGFYAVRAKQFILGQTTEGGLEDLLQRQVKSVAKSTFGVSSRHLPD